MKQKISIEKIKKAWFDEKPSNIKSSSAGKAYERKVLTRLETHKNLNGISQDLEIIDHPWVRYVLSTKTRDKWYACEPDTLVFDHQNMTLWIIESKSWKYMGGYYELKETYLPLLKFMFPEYDIFGLVVNQKKGTSLLRFHFNGERMIDNIKLLKLAA